MSASLRIEIQTRSSYSLAVLAGEITLLTAASAGRRLTSWSTTATSFSTSASSSFSTAPESTCCSGSPGVPASAVHGSPSSLRTLPRSGESSKSPTRWIPFLPVRPKKPLPPRSRALEGPLHAPHAALGGVSIAR